MFALCPALILNAGEAKQYSLDVFISTALLYLGLQIDEAITTRRAAVLGAVGAVAMWFSHPALFMLAAIGGLVAFRVGWRAKSRNPLAILMLAVPWLVSFSLMYSLNLRQLSRNQDLLTYWEGSFVPLSIAGAVKWMWYSYWNLILDPFGHGEPAGYLLAWLFAVGLIWLCTNRAASAWLLVGPLLFTVLASAFHLYPFGGFGGRLLLFTIPSIALGAAAGWRVVAANRSWLITGTLAIAIFLPMLKMAARQARGDVKDLRQAEELRPLIQRMRQGIRPGDHVYVFSGAEPAFSLYADHFGYLSGTDLQVTTGGVNFLQKHAVYAPEFERDLAPLKGAGRVWVIHSSAYWQTSSDEEVLVAAARKYGNELASFHAPGASVRLFSFER